VLLKHQIKNTGSFFPISDRRSVEKLWKEQEFFSSLNTEREILAVLRKHEVVQLVWKQTSTKVTGDDLARYCIKEIKEVGFLID
jgi:hypothetical protein